jgi:hemerythrin-like domain-containing protein
VHTSSRHPRDASRHPDSPIGAESFADVVRDEHAALLGRFDDFREAVSPQARQRIGDELCEALEIHLRLEEDVLHPVAGRLLQDSAAFAVALRGDVEHELLRELTDRLRGLYVTEDEYGACLAVLESHLLAHVESEEDDLLPVIEGRLCSAALTREWARRREAVLGATALART